MSYEYHALNIKVKQINHRNAQIIHGKSHLKLSKLILN